MATQKYLFTHLASKVRFTLFLITITVLVACSNQNPTDNVSGSNFDYLIRVFDQTTNHPINNVKVTISIAEQAPINEYTDTEGIARFTLNNSYANTKARLNLVAEGYDLKDINIDIYRDQLPQQIKLNPIQAIGLTLEPTNQPAPTTVEVAPTAKPTFEPTFPPKTELPTTEPTPQQKPPVTEALVSLRKTFTDYTKPIWGLTFSPDDNSLFATAETDQILRWNSASGQRMDEYGSDGGKSIVRGDIAISPDGSLIAVPSAMNGDDSGGIGSIQLYQIADGELIQTFEGFTSFAWTVDFSFDGTTLAGAGNDGTIRLWNINQPETARILRGHSGLITRIRFSPDGTKLASLSSYDGSVRIWDLTTNQQIQKFSEIRNSLTLAWTPDNQFIIVGSTIDQPQIQIFNVITGSIERTILSDNTPTTVDISPDGEIIAATCDSASMCLWSLDTGTQLAKFGSSSPNIIQWNHDGKLIASGDNSGKIELWEVTTQ